MFFIIRDFCKTSASPFKESVAIIKIYKLPLPIELQNFPFQSTISDIKSRVLQEGLNAP
jgi:hypothetical protein